jgi:cytochrome c2
MQKHPMQPILAIAIALLVLGGALSVIDPTDDFLSLMVPTASAEEYRYAAKPVGWDGPAGSCVVCHNLEKGAPWRVAPTLWGIVGAPKAGATGYGYSQALATAGGTWTVKELDDYLANPGKFLPGTSKTISGVTDPEERARIIKFLGTLKD